MSIHIAMQWGEAVVLRWFGKFAARKMLRSVLLTIPLLSRRSRLTSITCKSLFVVHAERRR